MTNFEMVEKLRQTADVSYEEAQAALEKSSWDLLDAVLLLEREGKIPLTGGSYSTRAEKAEPEAEPDGHRGPGELRRFFRWLGKTLRKLIRIGNTNSLKVSRRGEELFSLPVTVYAVLILCSLSTVFIAMAVGLFCGCRYSFIGPDLGREGINSAMNKAADAVESVKDEIRRPEAEKKETL